MTSPLLATIYLHAFDQKVGERGLGVLVRSADDFVILCRTPEQAKAALEGARDILAPMGSQLHPDKTRVAGVPIEVLIEQLNPVLRGWGSFFRTGNAAPEFGQVDDYVYRRLRRLLVKKRGRTLRAGQANQWTADWCHDHGLYRLRGTIRYPQAA